MPLLTLDTLTLRSQHYSESSRIVTFLCRERGLVKGIAKGARGKKGRFGSTLEPMQRVRVTFSLKENRGLQTVTQADLLHPYARIREDLFRSTYAQAVLELTGRVMWHESHGEDVFELLLAVLQAHEEEIGDPQLLFFAFQVHLADALGYALHLEQCSVCGGTLQGEVSFSFPHGAAFCQKCYTEGGASARVSGEALALCARLGKADGVAAAASLTPSRKVRRQVERLLQRHLEYHTETDLTLRSLNLAESIERYDSATPPSAGMKGVRK